MKRSFEALSETQMTNVEHSLHRMAAKKGLLKQCIRGISRKNKKRDQRKMWLEIIHGDCLVFVDRNNGHRAEGMKSNQKSFGSPMWVVNVAITVEQHTTSHSYSTS